MNFKYPVDNIDCLNNVNSQSQAGQDLFVIAMLKGKLNGTFLEIGAGLPVIGNNTWLLERYFGFCGTSIDVQEHTSDTTSIIWKNFYSNIRDSSWPDADSIDQLPVKIQNECKFHGYEEYVLAQGIHTWATTRPNTDFCQHDATKFDYSTIPTHVDYLQIDIDTPANNLLVLNQLIDSHEFSVITFEHDAWTATAEAYHARDKSREILKSHGYELIANDVCEAPGMSMPGKYPDSSLLMFEDWWANPNTIDPEVIAAYRNITENKPGKYYTEILFNND